MVNAALSVSAIASSDLFDLSKTYFLLNGIAGVNPRMSTICSVAFARFAIQVDTQMELDAREIPTDWPTGYVPMGADSHNCYPTYITGSEVFELNDTLRQHAMTVATTVELVDSDIAKRHRARFAGSPEDMYHAATLAPTVLEGDVLSSNTFFHGKLLGDAMGHAAKVYTTGKAEYVMTAQEDTAILAALLRAAIQGTVDFSRILIARAGSNFDRQPSENNIPTLPYNMDESGGLGPALQNLYVVGTEIIRSIVKGWDSRFAQGLESEGYVGDIFASLGGEPDLLPKIDVTATG